MSNSEKTLYEQRLVDATPPEDFPPQCIVIDHGMKQAPYYLRVHKTEHHVDHIELADANGPAMSLVAAVQICTRDGYHPTHYLEIKNSKSAHGPWLIPSGIVRRPASAIPASKT